MIAFFKGNIVVFGQKKTSHAWKKKMAGFFKKSIVMFLGKPCCVFRSICVLLCKAMRRNIVVLKGCVSEHYTDTRPGTGTLVPWLYPPEHCHVRNGRTREHYRDINVASRNNVIAWDLCRSICNALRPHSPGRCHAIKCVGYIVRKPMIGTFCSCL